jgi:hypothetical protein
MTGCLKVIQLSYKRGPPINVAPQISLVSHSQKRESHTEHPQVAVS